MGAPGKIVLEEDYKKIKRTISKFNSYSNSRKSSVIVFPIIIPSNTY